ncbi:uncharacterized protein [Lolium perenne]|uniref:uncharacterized protein isoform X3 n=1 Tax=Lolium perenne TaxID=4522 RepID=UPI003A9A45C3
MQATRIMEELAHLKQGTQSVTEYAGEVKRLYRDLHYYHPFQPVDKNDLAIHHKWFESLVAKLFLDGLNQEFDLRRQLLFAQPMWPSLDDIISSVLEEETRLGHCKEDDLKGGDDNAALSMRPRYVARPFGKSDNSKLYCDHCRRKGHTEDACFERNGFPSWWNKGRQWPGGVQAASKRQANHVTSVQDSLVPDSRDLEEFNSKGRLCEGASYSKGPYKAESTLLATSSQDLGTGRVLGTGTEHDGLYYLDNGSDEVALTSCLSLGGSLIHNNTQSQGEEKEDDSDSCQGDTGDATRTLSHPLQVAESPMHEDPGSLEDRRSTSGYCTYVGGNLVSWRSKKQGVVARSTAKAEFRSMAHGICELLWLKILLTELKLYKCKTLMLYCDNKAAIDIANNPIQHDRTKHVEIDRHFIKEKLDRGVICLPYVTSASQVADVLTKGLPEKLFNTFL